MLLRASAIFDIISRLYHLRCNRILFGSSRDTRYKMTISLTENCRNMHRTVSKLITGDDMYIVQLIDVKTCLENVLCFFDVVFLLL